MGRKKLPIGIQDFAELIQGGYLYVDKTAYYHQLITEGKYYFLSRPRRFGKSLLISTLKAIFEGRRDLFEGLWIYNKIDWETTPVIHLDFTLISKRAKSLEEGIRLELLSVAQSHGVRIPDGTNAAMLLELIKELSKEGKVAILVDEYDKPLIDNIDDLSTVERNRQVLKDMYSVIKGNDAQIAFLILTGVTKFSQVSIFSDLNHLADISLTPAYAQMLGYTHEEILHFFADHLEVLKAKLSGVFPDVMEEMKAWYNGYSWDGEHHVYNPFSVLNLFLNNRFREYWFATGTPTFLMKLIRARQYGIFDLEGSEIHLRALDKFDLPEMEILPLLFQTGYLTIREVNDRAQTVRLNFPNQEVGNAFSAHLLAEFSEKGDQNSQTLVMRMATHLRAGAVQSFIEAMKALMAGIAYPIQPAGDSGIENHEKYYHTIFYLVLKLLGYDVQAEVLTNTGRIDAVINTDRHIYVVEFKIGDAASALAQVKAMGYHQAYMNEGKQVHLVGIGFDVPSRSISGYLAEDLGR